MYPLHPNLNMEIAASYPTVNRRQEWPDDPDRVLVRNTDLPRDPVYLALRRVRIRLSQRLANLLVRTNQDGTLPSVGPARIDSIGERPANSDGAKAA